MVPIEYTPGFVANPDEAFQTLWNELAWVHRDNTPRIEYYCHALNLPYTYGKGAGERTYEPQPYHPLISAIQGDLERKTGTVFEVCFLNGYRDGSDQLGWHADDSPEMDDTRPIGIVSLGARREIYFKRQLPKGVENVPDKFDGIVSEYAETTKLWLDSGSLCIMKPGMQDTHFHRIPKSSIMNCGPRISLTFRGAVAV